MVGLQNDFTLAASSCSMRTRKEPSPITHYPRCTIEQNVDGEARKLIVELSISLIRKHILHCSESHECNKQPLVSASHRAYQNCEQNHLPSPLLGLFHPARPMLVYETKIVSTQRAIAYLVVGLPTSFHPSPPSLLPVPHAPFLSPT